MLAKFKLNGIDVLISKALSDSDVSHDEFVQISNVLKEFYNMKEEIKNSNDKQTINKRMLSYCLKCRKNTESKKTNVLRTKNGRIMLLSKCEVCDSKKSKFIKGQEAS